MDRQDGTDYPCARAPHGAFGHSADGTTWTDQPDEETNR